MRPPAWRNPLLVISLCLASCWLNAQRASSTVRTSIRGSVRDAVTHRVLPRVIVMVEAVNSGYAGQAETDASGKFELQGLGATSYVIRVRFPGYEEMSQGADLSVTPSIYLSFELRPKPGNLPPAVAPEGPDAHLNARMAAVPEKARKEFAAARDLWQIGADPQRCMDHLDKAIKLYPRFPDAYVLRATVSIQQKNAAEAKSALDRAVEIDPKLPEAWFTLGMLQNNQKDYAGAEKNLIEGLKLDDGSPQGHYELAKTYWALGRWQDAEPQALKAAALQPAMAPVHVLLGNIALRKRDAPGALKEFQEYLRLDPKGPMAEGTQSMVKKLQEGLSSPN
ncbi:MAG TPA: tetratricopeptide repeat protein [Nitrospira sp.]